jgi:Predicted membrane protein (DUF2306)
MTTATTLPAARSTAARATFSYDRLFYSGTALALALLVAAGFAPTYYARFLSGGPSATVSGGPFTTLVHLHGALFTGWVLLFIGQTSLIASRRVSLHRKLGILGAVLAAAMVMAGTSLTISTAARGGAPPGIEPLAFLAIPLFDMVLFTTFVTTAIVLRRNKEAHKRLMLLAYVCLVGAAAARLPGPPPGPFAFYGIAFLFVVAGALYDLFSRRRIHSVYLWGGALIAVSVPTRLLISSTGAWRTIAEFLTR